MAEPTPSSAPLKTAEGAITVTEVELTPEQKLGLISSCKGPLPGVAAQVPAAAGDDLDCVCGATWTPRGKDGYEMVATPRSNSPALTTTALPTTEDSSAGEQAQADPMDWPLPCDVTVGCVTICKGVKLRTLVTRMEVLHKMATAQAEVQAEPVAWAAVYFGGKRAGKIYNTCDTQEQALEYINLVEQSNDSITLTAKPVFFAAAPQAQPADELLLNALELACRHIDMGALRISHCKDAAAIDAAMAAAQEGGKQ